MNTEQPDNDGTGRSQAHEQGRRRPLIVNPHRPRSVRIWIIPLILILGVIFFLPRLLELLFG